MIVRCLAGAKPPVAGERAAANSAGASLAASSHVDPAPASTGFTSRAKRGLMSGWNSMYWVASKMASAVALLPSAFSSASPIAPNHRLRRLNLSGNFLSTGGLIALAQLLATNHTLAAVYLDSIHVCHVHLLCSS